MKKQIAAALLVASLMIVGCEKKEDTAPQVNKAQDKVADQAADAMSKIKSNTADAADQAKDSAKTVASQAGDAAKQIQDQIDKLIDQAKSAVKDKKWDDATNYVNQVKDLKSKLPESVQPKIDAAIADVQKLIDAGKKLGPGANATPQ